MEQTLTCRVTLAEKRLVQAWAARRRACVAQLIRECVLTAVRAEFGMDAENELQPTAALERRDGQDPLV